MNVLEKILEEIKEVEKRFVVGHEVLFALGATGLASEITEIISSHMDEAKDTNVPSNDGWIPVEERLPEEPKFMEDSYIVQQKNVIDPFSAYWDGKEWTDVNDDKVEEVIAWQPLPAPYKPKKQN